MELIGTTRNLLSHVIFREQAIPRPDQKHRDANNARRSG
jgi:hypothetical protein